MKHIRYLRYVVIHKWFVLIACLRRGLIWQGVIHDWSKFLPSEWMPYAEFFYGFKPTDEERRQARIAVNHEYPSTEYIRGRFDVAWLKHQHRSPHHWQHWILREDSGATFPIAMPRRYALEMLCDWDGAGRAITGKSGGTPAWYSKNRDRIQLHPETRALVETELRIE